MPDPEVDLFASESSSVTAPAGCGKTHLIAETLRRHSGPKPILVLTHTNAGVAALRGRLSKLGVSASAYRLSTIDGWSMRISAMFPARSGIDPETLRLENARSDYPAIHVAALRLLTGGHVQDVLRANFARIIVDEYQDCSIQQHRIVCGAADALPTCALGDPMQAIFNFRGPPIDWQDVVCARFPATLTLSTPWRWVNAGTEGFGRWLLDVRERLMLGQQVDLSSAPPEVTWVELDGTEDHMRQLRAGQTRAVNRNGAVLIIGESTSPASQRSFASQIPGATMVEAVDLRDLVDFARNLDFQAADAVDQLVDFAGSVISGVGAADFKRRIQVLTKGTERQPASNVEAMALRFIQARTPDAGVDLLLAIESQQGVRTHRPDVLRACIRALRGCAQTGGDFYQSAVVAREQNRLLGRALPRRAVGSTLLLKGLEAEVAVILNTEGMNARHLYVAMTRGANRLVVCSRSATLP